MVKILLAVIGCYLALILILYLNQRHYIYFPHRIAVEPNGWGVSDMAQVKLTTADGLKLIAWYKKAQATQPTIVYFHGNEGHIGQRGFIARPLLDRGFGLLLVEYRGYSTNPGKPSEKGLYQDGRAALLFLQQQKVKPQCIVLFGESLGTAIAIQLATESQIGALILQSPFTSLAEVGQRAYKIFPVKLLVKDKYDSLAKAPKIQVPTLVIYGQKDWIVPADLSQKLYDALPEPKALVTFSNAGHNNMPLADEEIVAFLQRYVRCDQ